MCLGLQIYALLVTFYDLALNGAVGWSAFGYGAIQPIAIPAFLIGMVLTYDARKKRSVKWAYGVYFGSHLIILTCVFLFPGKFGL